MPDTPPWIQPADPAAQYLRGLQIGSSIGEAQSQLAQAEERMRMQNQAQREQLAQNALLAQTRLDYQQAYQNAQLKLDEKRLEDAAARNAEIMRHNKAMEQRPFGDPIAGQKWLVDQQRTQYIASETARRPDAPFGDIVKEAVIKFGPPSIGVGMYERLWDQSVNPKLTGESALEASTLKAEGNAFLRQIAQAEADGDADKLARLMPKYQDIIDRQKQLVREARGGKPKAAMPETGLPPMAPGMAPTTPMRIGNVTIGGPPGMAATPVAATTQAPVPARRNEVTRRTKSGKLAVFDADTKEFLRYAD